MCGIAGIISKEPTPFNLNHFNLLGTLNDERGGDSCGIFIDKKYQYGVKDTKMFRIFSKCISDYPTTAQNAFLHCRKTSVGYVTGLEQAQPVIISNNEKIEFVLMHNGTITNASKLAKTYIPNINVTKMSDSQMMANIIYNCGYDVLTEYEGAAVFAIIDYRNVDSGEVFLWKGNSCYNEYKESSERPLFYMIHDDKFYFSSMYISLYCIDYTANIINLPTNTLFKIVNNELIPIKVYDRTILKKPVYNQTTYLFPSTDYIRYNQYNGLYMDGNEVAHGIYTVYCSGLITRDKSIYVYTLYFLYGRLIYTKEAYDLLADVLTLFEDNIIESSLEIIDYFAYNPIKRAAEFFTVNEAFQYEKVMDRKWHSLFNDCIKYEINSGHLSIKTSWGKESIEFFMDEAKRMYFDYEILKEDLVTYLLNKNTDVNIQSV